MDDEHIFAFVEAIHGTYLNAVRVLAFDAVLGNHKRHSASLLSSMPRGKSG
jgi:hypothetical protein